MGYEHGIGVTPIKANLNNALLVESGIYAGFDVTLSEVAKELTVSHSISGIPVIHPIDGSTYNTYTYGSFVTKEGYVGGIINPTTLTIQANNTGLKRIDTLYVRYLNDPTTTQSAPQIVLLLPSSIDDSYVKIGTLEVPANFVKATDCTFIPEPKKGDRNSVLKTTFNTLTNGTVVKDLLFDSSVATLGTSSISLVGDNIFYRINNPSLDSVIVAVQSFTRTIDSNRTNKSTFFFIETTNTIYINRLSNIKVSQPFLLNDGGCMYVVYDAVENVFHITPLTNYEYIDIYTTVSLNADKFISNTGTNYFKIDLATTSERIIRGITQSRFSTMSDANIKSGQTFYLMVSNSSETDKLYLDPSSFTSTSTRKPFRTKSTISKDGVYKMVLVSLGTTSFMTIVDAASDFTELSGTTVFTISTNNISVSIPLKVFIKENFVSVKGRIVITSYPNNGEYVENILTFNSGYTFLKPELASIGKVFIQVGTSKFGGCCYVPSVGSGSDSIILAIPPYTHTGNVATCDIDISYQL